MKTTEDNRIYGIIGAVIGDIAGSRFHNTRFGRFNRRPLKGFPIHDIGTSIDTIKHDVEALVAKVKAEPQTIFVVEDVGISRKTNLGVATMAPLFEPLKDMENVYFVEAYWQYYNKR